MEDACHIFNTCEAQAHGLCIEKQPYLALLLTQYVPDLHRVSRLQLFVGNYACISAAAGARSKCFLKLLAAKSRCSLLSSVPTPTQVPLIQHSCLPSSCPWPCLTLAPHLSASQLVQSARTRSAKARYANARYNYYLHVHVRRHASRSPCVMPCPCVCLALAAPASPS